MRCRTNDKAILIKDDEQSAGVWRIYKFYIKVNVIYGRFVEKLDCWYLIWISPSQSFVPWDDDEDHRSGHR